MLPAASGFFGCLTSSFRSAALHVFQGPATVAQEDALHSSRRLRLSGVHARQKSCTVVAVPEQSIPSSEWYETNDKIWGLFPSTCWYQTA